MVIHQCLHGYNQGHHKITASINLSTKDEDLMKVLSDWSMFTRGSVDDDVSYITCYPLHKENFYVVAKSWYADEMPRPGCVWTHSLIIDLSKIDESFDFRGLLNFFHRPNESGFTVYAKPFETTNDDWEKIDKNNRKLNLGISQLENILFSLVERDNKNYCIERENEFYQNLCLSLLQYLPVGIIKYLTICTGTGCERTYEGKMFNLQFSVSSSQKLTSNINNKFTDNSIISVGVEYFTKAILADDKDSTGLVRFFSNDILESSENLWLTGWLLKSLDSTATKEETVNYQELLSAIIRCYPNSDEGNLSKEVFLSKNIATLFTSESDYCLLVCTLLKSEAIEWVKMELDNKIISYLDSFNKRINFLNSLIKSENINAIGESVLKKESFSFTNEEFAQIAEDNWNIFVVLLNYNHKILKDPYWIYLSVDKISQIVHLLFKYQDTGFTKWDDLFSKCLNDNLSIGYEDIKKLVNYCTEPLTILMNYVKIHTYRKLHKDFILAFEGKDDVFLKWLGNQRLINENIVTFILDKINPQTLVVKNSGSNPWRLFFAFDNGARSTEYYIFLFLLSLNWKDQLAEQMLKISFYHLYIALADSQLNSWQMNNIVVYMPELPFWQSWDNCKKLSKGIIRAMIKMGYQKSDLKDFTPDNKVNERLEKIWKKEYKS